MKKVKSTAKPSKSKASAASNSTRARTQPLTHEDVAPSTGSKRKPRVKQIWDIDLVPDEHPDTPRLTGAEILKALGRPSVYNPEYCAKVMEWGGQGKSLTWFAATLLVTRDTIYEWSNRHKEFSDALYIAKLREQKYWEDLGQQGAEGRNVNSAIWAKNMACRFRNDWQESRNVEISGVGGGAIKLEVDDGELARRLSATLMTIVAQSQAPTLLADADEAEYELLPYQPSI